MENENENPFLEVDTSDIPDTVETEEEVVVDDTSEPKTAEPTSEAVTDEQKLLSLLKEKVKYNGESVDISSIDDVVNNYQKGLNYDNLKSKTEKSENAVMSYIQTKAKSMNMTPEQYIEQVQKYEQEQIKAKNEDAIQSMVQNNVPEDVAREIIETRALRESLQKEKAELEEQKKTAEAEQNKDKEMLEFLNQYPGIEVDKIPAEVFENAKKSNLLSAYQAYENKQLKEKLKIMEQNQNNASTSPVKPVGETVNEESQDAFLLGFTSE